jgi:hypothetical protein
LRCAPAHAGRIVQRFRRRRACFVVARANVIQMLRASLELRRLIFQMQLAQMDQLAEKSFTFHR